MSDSFDNARERIIRRTRQQIAECDQAVRDVEYWNKINPKETPFDPAPFRAMADLHGKILQAALERRPIDPEWTKQLIAIAEAE